MVLQGFWKAHLQQTGEPNRNRKTEPELNRNRMNRTGKPNRLNRTGTELEPNPGGHEIYHFDQNFKPAFYPLKSCPIESIRPLK